jgi:hypothetical protein
LRLGCGRCGRLFTFARLLFLLRTLISALLRWLRTLLFLPAAASRAFFARRSLRRLGPASAILLRPGSALLLEFLHLLLHEPACLRFALRGQLVVAAVRAALPAFRIGFPATGAEDTFR